jgi:hypothetical protein
VSSMKEVKRVFRKPILTSVNTMTGRHGYLLVCQFLSSKYFDVLLS